MNKKIKNIFSTAAATVATFSSDIASKVSEASWLKELNSFSSELSKSFDANFLREGISKAMNPNNHRIMDGGHDFFTTLEKASELGKEKGWSSLETFQEWSQAYFTDFSSKAGMPIFGKMSDEIYSFLKMIGVSDELARDAVTLNSEEAINAVLGASLSAVGLLFAWKNEDKESFSRVVSSVFLSGAVSANPATLVVRVIALAIGFNKLVCPEVMARGAILSGLSLGISSAIGGRCVVGMVPAIIIAIYASKKMGKDFKPIEYSAEILKLLTSKRFREICEELFAEFQGKKNSQSVKMLQRTGIKD